jgi:hypothetical protein
MEDLFAPTTRLRDLYHARERGDGYGRQIDEVVELEEQMNRLVELELITGSSVEDTFLHWIFVERLLLVCSRKDRVDKPRRIFRLCFD